MINQSLTGLKINQLRLITAIAEHQRISTAAEVLNMTQPAASRMLSDMEKIVDAKLCERHPKGMKLTLVGRALARRAQNMILEMRDLSRDIHELKSGKGGVARMGAVTGGAVRYVVPAIAQTKAAFPNVEMHLNVANSETLIKGLFAGDYDFILGRIPAHVDATLFNIDRAQVEKIDFLVRKDHPLSSSKSLSLTDIDTYEWVIQSLGAPIREAVEKAFIDCGISPPKRITNTSSLLVTISILASSTAISPIAREVSELLTGDKVGANLKILPIRENVEIEPYNLITVVGRQLSPTAHRLKELVLMDLERSEG